MRGNDVAQGFLRDPVEAERRLGGGGREVSLRAASQDRCRANARSSAQYVVRAATEARVPEHGGMQVVGEVADVLREARPCAGGARRRSACRSSPAGSASEPAPEAAEGDRQSRPAAGSRRRADRGDARALGVLGLDQAAGQTLDLRWLASRAARLARIRVLGILRSVMSMLQPMSTQRSGRPASNFGTPESSSQR